MSADAQLDARVLECVKGGMSRLMAIEARLDIKDVSVRKSLQRLRTSGAVAYASGPGWHVPAKPKPSSAGS